MSTNRTVDKESSSMIPGIGEVKITIYKRPENCQSRVRVKDEHGNCGWGKNTDTAMSGLRTCRKTANRADIVSVLNRSPVNPCRSPLLGGKGGKTRRSKPRLSD